MGGAAVGANGGDTIFIGVLGAATVVVVAGIVVVGISSY
jgi:hypothetical protein